MITSVLPLTEKNWDDLERLFGSRGACGGCWCMWPRLKRSDFEERKGDGNKDALKNLVKSGKVPGLLGYSGSKPIAWCALGPREDFDALTRSRIMKPLDDQAVWSIVCFFIANEYRRNGVSVDLLRHAVRYAKKHGAKLVEGYPVEPKKRQMPPVFAYYGVASAFLQVGFAEVARRSPTRPFMRYVILDQD